MRKTADVHIGPDFSWEKVNGEGVGVGEMIGKWESWGLWRGSGKDVVEWWGEWETERG